MNSSRFQQSSSDPSVSIIIPVYNGGNKFKLCLQSLLQFATGVKEIIVVADGDTDGSGDLAESLGFKVIRLPVAGGPARARNLGAKEARGDILFFLDADVTISKNIIQKVQEAFKQDSNLAALIGSYDDSPGASNFLSQYKNLFHHYVHQISSEKASTFWGACGAIDRDVFWKVNGFNEAYRLPSIEDIELGYRLREAGYRIRLCKDIQVKHLKRWGPLSLLRADFFYRAVPWTVLILRHHRFINDLNLRWENRVSVVLAYLFSLCLIMVYWWKIAVVLALFPALLFLKINASVYSFFKKKRGLLFALRVIPWHYFYYLYSGLAFGLGHLLYWFS